VKRLPQLAAAERLRRIHDRLAAAYGPQHWWPAQTPLEVILGAYLTQNTSWKAVERSLANLREANALHLGGLRVLSLRKLQRLIQPSGFYTRKAAALKAFITLLDAEFNGSIETMAAAPTAQLRERLLTLPGVGPETADAILLYALGHPVPVADEYLRRIVQRHQLSQPSPAKDRKEYGALVALTRAAFNADPAADRLRLYNEFHALTVAVGKAHCGKSASCAACPLAADLNFVSSFLGM
jgi:endonuclease-3 related protein